MTEPSGALLRGSLPPLRGKDRMGGPCGATGVVGVRTPPFLTFPRKGGRDPRRRGVVSLLLAIALSACCRPSLPPAPTGAPNLTPASPWAKCRPRAPCSGDAATAPPRCTSSSTASAPRTAPTSPPPPTSPARSSWQGSPPTGATPIAPGAATDRQRAPAASSAPPRPVDTPRPVRFAWGGDVGGQNACRDAARGYPIFDRSRARQLDFFIGLGDMIYADDAVPAARPLRQRRRSPARRRPLTSAAYWAHWRYNRDEANFQRLLAARALLRRVGRSRDPRRQRPARRRFPARARRPPAADRPARLSRLSSRSFRQRRRRTGSTAACAGASTSRSSCSIRASTATRSPAPDSRHAARRRCSAPSSSPGSQTPGALGCDLEGDRCQRAALDPHRATARGRDGFADGGGARLRARGGADLRALRADGIRNSVWITTDVHFATGFVLPAVRRRPQLDVLRVHLRPAQRRRVSAPRSRPDVRPRAPLLLRPTVTRCDRVATTRRSDGSTSVSSTSAPMVL